MLGPPLEDLLHLCEALLDPLDRRSLKHLLSATPQPVQLLAERVDPAHGLDQRSSECLASSSFSDEVDEVRETSLFAAKLRFLREDGLGHVRVELGHLLLDSLEQLPNVLGLGPLLAHRLQDDLLGELSPHDHLVLARTLRSTQTSIVAPRPSRSPVRSSSHTSRTPGHRREEPRSRHVR